MWFLQHMIGHLDKNLELSPRNRENGVGLQEHRHMNFITH